ncbi:nucleotidyltransferase family protein [soil metagenome]
MNAPTLSKLQELKAEILHIAQKHGASNVLVFGSVARNEATLESDLDFLVELEPNRSLLDHAALVAELQEVLGYSVDVATVKGLKAGVRQHILSEAVPL